MTIAVKSSISQVLLMAAITTTLLWLPVGALLGLVCFALLGISFHAFLTFADTVNGFQGLLVWWVLGFLPALAYAAYFRPWDARD
jgi:hypothetical protein